MIHMGGVSISFFDAIVLCVAIAFFLHFLGFTVGSMRNSIFKILPKPTPRSRNPIKLAFQKKTEVA